MEDFRRFILPNILPEGSTLILNVEEGILSLLSKGDLVKQQVLSPLEMVLIIELLEAYPQHCSNEVLLSILTHESVEKCRQQLLNALKDHTMRVLTKRLRETLAHCRRKLHAFGIDIVTLQSTGSILEPLTRKARNRTIPERIQPVNMNS